MWGLLPLSVLIGGVVSGRVSVARAGLAAVLVTGVLGALVYGAGPGVLAVALGKGLWLGVWISFVVVPALLLFRIAMAGGLAKTGIVFERVSDRPREQVLLVAWLGASLFQGVAGFGAPIAITAPLLLAMGISAVRAVTYPLVGYCWSVTFGSMATSYYTAVVTSGADAATIARFTLLVAVLLGGLAVLSGLAVAAMDGGWDGVRRSFAFVVVVGVPMAGVLVLVALVAPAVASTAAAATGIVIAAVYCRVRARLQRRPRHRGEPGELRQGLLVLLPYGALVVILLTVFLVPVWQDWIDHGAVLGFSFPETTTGRGWVNAAAEPYRPMPLLSHPGTYLLLVCAFAVVLFRRTRIWQGPSVRTVLVDWLRATPKAAAPVIVFAVFALLLTDTGMIQDVARVISSLFGSHVLLIAPIIGALGSFLTGSSTSSNAVFAPLQAQAAGLAGVDQGFALAGQAAGANVGNSTAPVVITVGASTVGAEHAGREILVRVAPWAGGLLLVLLVCGAVFDRIGG